MEAWTELSAPPFSNFSDDLMFLFFFQRTRFSSSLLSTIGFKMNDLSITRRVLAIFVFFFAVSAFLTGEAAFEEPTRIWGEKCTKSDLVINQGPTAPLPTGIPTYSVEVVNACVTGCDIHSIHFKCGWFSSAHLINPRVFKRLRYDDCLVNDGKPLVYGGMLSFQYANTFPYPLSVSRVGCS